MAKESTFFVIDTVDARKMAADFVARLTGSPVMCVDVRPYKRNRSAAQNRLMWKWYTVIGNETGNKPEDLHDYMKARVLGFETKSVLGKEMILPKSTTKLSVEEMISFLEAIEALAIGLNIRLPVTDEYGLAMGRESRAF